MKYWLALLLLFPLASFAQECKLKKAKDPFTNQTRLSTGFQKFDGNGLSISISADATPAEVDFFIWVKDDGKCFDAESTALVAFDGERSKATLRNSGSINCEGAFHFSFKNTPTTHAVLNRLATKKLASITLTGHNKTEVLITLSEEQKTLLQHMASCIAAEAKSLLPQ